jgi:hypothetical protein
VVKFYASMILATLALFIPEPAHAQHRPSGSVAVFADMSILPALQALGLGADVRVWKGIALNAAVQRKGEWLAACIESSPSPCSPKGLSVSLGVRLVAESGGSWWPYAEGAYGGHRYSSRTDWRPYWDAGAGLGFYVGARGSIWIGLNYGRIAADPPLLEEWRRPGDSYVHSVGRVVMGTGLRVR